MIKFEDLKPILEKTDKGLRLNLHIQPGAKRSAIVGLHAGRLKIAVQGKAVEGQANDALVELLAASFGVSKSRVTIVRGARSRQKTVEVEGEPERLESRLSMTLDGNGA